MELWAISDIHGYSDKLTCLLNEIGILEGNRPTYNPDKHVVFLGDYIDRGTQPLETLMTVSTLCEYGIAHAILGNHDSWLLRYLKGNNVKMTEEREQTLMYLHNSPLYKLPYNFDEDIVEFLESLPYWLELDGYKFVHATYDHRSVDKPKKKQSLMLYGPVVNNELDEKGFPQRIPWYEGYDGRHGKVIFGHYSLDNKVSEFPNAVSVDCGVFKTGVLGAYEVHTGRKIYV